MRQIEYISALGMQWGSKETDVFKDFVYIYTYIYIYKYIYIYIFYIYIYIYIYIYKDMFYINK